MPYFVLLPILARDTLGQARGFGLLMAMSGLGPLRGLTLAGAPAPPAMPRFWGPGPLLPGAHGPGLCRNYYAALGFMALAGFGLVTQLSTATASCSSTCRTSCGAAS